ncbi:MAG: ABC transporter permease, partial [Firmicutes bacterium]|nr:ABC transporter permease [Bacillota bacterium]
MSFLDQLKWSLRHFKRQLVESFLIILAIALGVAVIVTVLTLFLSAGRQFSAVGLEDYFRTFQVVSKLEGTSRETPPLVLIGSEGLPDRDWETTLGEIEELQNNLPPDMHVFVETIWLVQTPLLQETEREEDNDWFGWTEGNSIFLTGTTQRYFSFKEMSLHSGNWFLAEDVENQNKVVIITSQLAARLFGEEEPLGKTLPIKAGEDL